MEHFTPIDNQETPRSIETDALSAEKIKEQFDAIVGAIGDHFQTFSPAEVERLTVEASDKTWGDEDDSSFKPYTGPSIQ